MRRPAVGRDNAPFQAERAKHRIVERGGPLQIAGSHRDVAEHRRTTFPRSTNHANAVVASQRFDRPRQAGALHRT